MSVGPDLMRGTMDLLILSILAEGPTYGYRLLKRMRASSQDLLKVHAGTMYAALYKLEGLEAIVSRWDTSEGRPRKWYELTASGRQMLTEQARQWGQYVERSQRQIGPILDAITGGTWPKPATE